MVRENLKLGRSLRTLGTAAICLFALLVFRLPTAGSNENELGAFGPEGERLREQLWVVPSGDPNKHLRATVFRPADRPGSYNRHPLVVINHGTSAETRLALAMPVYYWLSRWFVERGYVAILPQRRGSAQQRGLLSTPSATVPAPITMLPDKWLPTTSKLSCLT